MLAGRALPALRHALVGELQAIKFGIGLARGSIHARRNEAEVLSAIHRIDESSDRSIAGAHALSVWLQPDLDEENELSRVVEGCLELVRTEWRIRGIEVAANVAGGSGRVRAWPLRELLAAVLFALGDSITTPSDVNLLIRRRGGAILFAVRARPVVRIADVPRAAWPRTVGWPDIDVLVRAHRASWRHGMGGVLLRIPAQLLRTADV